MNYLPPLRNYQQMVRVVQQHPQGNHSAKPVTDFSLANAFGSDEPKGIDTLFSSGGLSPTDLQLRTLDSMNLPSSSLRRSGNTGSGGLLPTRAGSTLFHDLNPSTQNYINGMNGGQTMSRRDAQPGTKFRTELDPNASSKKIYQHVHTNHQNDHRVIPSHIPPPHITTNNKRSKSSQPSHLLNH